MVRMSTELETNIVSVERVKEYSEAPTEVKPKTLLMPGSEVIFPSEIELFPDTESGKTSWERDSSMS